MPSRVAQLLHQPAMTLGLAFLISLVTLGLEAGTAEFEGDEADYVATSRYFGYLVLQRDVTRDEWGDNHWTRTQPPLTRYIIGAWLTARGFDLESLNQPYVSTASSVDVNRRKGRVPEDDVLAAARQPMVLLGAGAIALLVPLGTLLGGPLAGWAALTLALSSPFVRYTVVHAWAEAPLAFFLLLAALLAAVGARSATQSKPWLRWGLGVGLALGLTAATKLTGFVGIAATLAWGGGAVALLSRQRPSTESVGKAVPVPVYRRAGALWFAMTAASVAIAVFIVVNPYLWRGPVAGVIGMLHERQDEMAAQQQQWPEFAVSSPLQRPLLTLVGSLQVGPWAGTPGGLVVNLASLALAIAGLVRAARDHVAPPGRWPSVTMFLTWLGVYSAAIAYGLMLSYPRYFLPSCLLVLPLCGLGAATGVRWLRHSVSSPSAARIARLRGSFPSVR